MKLYDKASKETTNRLGFVGLRFDLVHHSADDDVSHDGRPQDHAFDLRHGLRVGFLAADVRQAEILSP